MTRWRTARRAAATVFVGLVAPAAVAAVLGIGALLRGRRTAGSTSNRPSS